MIGAAIGAGINAIGGIIGGVSKTRAMKKVKNQLESRKAENDNWFNRKYNEDATQRADAQMMIAKTQEALLRNNRNAAAQAAVMGGTDETLAAQREANARTLAETASNIAVAGANQKDSVEQQYMANRDNLDNQLNDIQMQKANNIGNAVSGLSHAASGIAGAF